jgi:hypothetical protein
MLVALLLLPTVGHAQMLTKGLRFGVGTTRLGGGDVESFDTRSTWAAGGGITVRGIPLVHLRVDLLYTRKGGQARVGSDAIHATLDTLHLPVFAAIGIGALPVIRPEIHLGGYWDLHVGRRLEVPLAGGLDGSDVFRRGDQGLLAGGGLSLNLGLIRASVSARWTWGMGSLIQPIEVGAVTVERNARHRGFMVVAGIDF